jgi:hypothetical protein
MIAVLALLSVLWTGPGRVVVSWSGPGCLYIDDALYACYPRKASYQIEVGGPGTDARYRPGPHTVYRLRRSDGAIEEARARSVVYIPVWK